MTVNESRKTGLEGFRVSRKNAGKNLASDDDNDNRLGQRF